MGGRKTGCGFVLFGLFFVAGCGALVMLVGAFLLTDWRANYRYQPNSCVVLDRRLQVQHDVNIGPRRVPGPSYHPEIRIRYEVDGRKYELWTYDAVPTWYPDKGGQQAILDSFQVGRTYPCWYDPDRPEKAILVRGHAWAPFLLLFVPLAFMTVGAIGMFNARENREKTALDLSQSSRRTLPYRLRCDSDSGCTVWACLLFALCWNGISIPLVILMIAGRLGLSSAQPSMPGQAEFFTILLALAGLFFVVLAVAFVITNLLIAIGVGPTIVELSRHPLEPGAPFEVFVSQVARRSLKMNSLRLVCNCDESAPTSGPERRVSGTRRVYEQEILALDKFALEPGLPLEARADFTLPHEAMHSIQTADKWVRWKLVVRCDIAGWPDFDREFPFVVRPSELERT